MADDMDISPNYDKNNNDLLENDISISFEDEKELEKYGVWVKTGPEEIDDIDENPDYNLTDLEDESIISDEEEELLGELEKELSEDNLGISENITNNLDNTVLDMDISELDDMELEELTNKNDIPEMSSTEEEIKDEEPFDLDIDFDDDFNDIEELSVEPVSENLTENSLDDDDIALDVLELENLDLDELDLEDLELDEIESDISGIESPKTIMEHNHSDNLDTNIEDEIELDLDVDSLLNNDLDNDLDIDLLLNEESIDSVLTDSLEDLDELEEISDQITEDILEINDEDEFDETEKIIEDLTEFDDLDEPELNNIIESENPNIESSSESNNIASDILKKIEQELLSIKNELHDVKKELSILKPDKSIESLTENKDSDIEEPGFFEEDEDETIALTGDELDNILNTADIIEETGAETETPDDLLEIDESIDNLGTDSLLVDNEDIITIEEEVIPDVDDSQDLKIDFAAEEEIIDLPKEDGDIENNLGNIEEIELIDDESFLTMETDKNEEDIQKEEILLTDLESEDLLSIDNDVLNTSEEISTDIDKDFDLDLEELSLDLEEIDSDIDNTNVDTEENNSDLEEISFNVEENELGLDVIDLDFEEIDKADDSFVNEIPPVTASEPEGSISIDMELPEMQEEENLTNISPQLKTEIKSVLSYMDHLLESLPEDKIDEFANSEHYEVYKKLFEELGLN